MGPEDSKAPFLRIPWAASLLKRPNIIVRVPRSRRLKRSGEDSLFADTLKTSRTLRSCVAFYQRPSPDQKMIEEISTLITLGDGVNGHQDIMHGGIVAAILDEAMGILQDANMERDHLSAVRLGHAEGELPSNPTSFTGELRITYLKPVRTPGSLIATARIVERDGRKEWLSAEIKQREGVVEDFDGEEIVCAKAEALFIEPRPVRSKL